MRYLKSRAPNYVPSPHFLQGSGIAFVALAVAAFVVARRRGNADAPAEALAQPAVVGV